MSKFFAPIDGISFKLQWYNVNGYNLCNREHNMQEHVSLYLPSVAMLFLLQNCYLKWANELQCTTLNQFTKGTSIKFFCFLCTFHFMLFFCVYVCCIKGVNHKFEFCLLHSISIQRLNFTCLKVFKLGFFFSGEPNSSSKLLPHVGCNNQGALSGTLSSILQSSSNVERRDGNEPIDVVCEPFEKKPKRFFENIHVF